MNRLGIRVPNVSRRCHSSSLRRCGPLRLIPSIAAVLAVASCHGDFTGIPADEVTSGNRQGSSIGPVTNLSVRPVPSEGPSQVATEQTIVRHYCVGTVTQWTITVDWSQYWNQTVTFTVRPQAGKDADVIGLAYSDAGPWTETLDVDVVLDGNGAGRSDPFYMKALKPGSTIIEACTSGGWCATQRGPAHITVAGLEKATFASSAALDDNPNAGGGKRVYPGKDAPGDASDRSTVSVELKGTANAKIFLRSFDVDDPSTDDAPVDSNGPVGQDNRGAPREGTLSQSTVDLDASGNGSADFTVTKHPGDNFRVAASCESWYLPGVRVSGTDLVYSGSESLPNDHAKVTPMLTVWREVHVELDVMAPVHGNVIRGRVAKARNGNSGAVLTLTDLTVEGAAIPTLEADKGKKGRFEGGRIILDDGTTPVGDYLVAGNGRNTVTLFTTITPDPTAVVGTPFRLVDDDDYNNSDTPLFPDGDEGEALAAAPATAAAFSHMRASDDPDENVFAPAYIRPVYDEANVTSDRDNVRFVLNLSTHTDSIDAQAARGRDSDGNESDDYWVVYLQLGYQAEETWDNDPGSESVVLGATTIEGETHDVTGVADVPKGGDVSIMFLETMHDNARGEDTATPHEVGHQFAISHGPRRKCGYGIMNSGCSEWPEFIPRHLNVLRWRVKSPGK